MKILIGLVVFLAGICTWVYKKFYNPDGSMQEMDYIPEPIPEPETEAIPPVNTKPMLDTFCTAIRDFEGNPGDANYKNNNPGNCRCSPVGYLPKYGKVKCSPAGFAIFPTYELGWEYLQNLVLHRATVHPEWTVLDFFNVYAPASDNNPPAHYADWVAKRCGCTTSTILANVFGIV